MFSCAIFKGADNMEDNSPERKSSCGLFGAVFGRRNLWQRRTTPTPPAPTNVNENGNPKKRRGPSDDADEVATKPAIKPTIPTREIVRNPQHPNEPSSKVSPTTQGYVNQGRKVPKEATGISGELESMISDHQKSKGSNMFVRASSGNVMLYSNLGNLRQPGAGRGGGNANANANAYNVMDHTPKTKEETPIANGRYTKRVTENVAQRTKENPKQDQGGGSLCRAVSTRMDPEQLKIMGNEDYKNGRFAEALALYDAAISIDPNKSSYRSNKSAALTALGRLLEAVIECREAIRIEPHYQRAHNRLGNLYLKLGETDKSQYHFKHAGQEADPDEIAKVRNVQVHLNKCTEARRVRDWNTLRKESNSAILAGADSAPLIFALQAEALLKLRKHDDADEVMSKGLFFGDDELNKFLGPIGFANLLVTRAQVDMAVGRFDDALEEAQRAGKLDPNNKEAGMVMRRGRAVAAARSKGNELFRASRFSEALAAYAEGLEHDPCNSVLLCNRAACRSKLGQFERAVEDCNAALGLRPSYSKARLRRADCNVKLERWEASIQDYEILLRETPEDEEVKEALLEVQKQLKKQRGGEV